MGFLSGLSGILGGGSQSSSQGSSQSGWALLPPEIRNTLTQFSTAAGSQIPNLTSAYTPMGQTEGETRAYDAINRGFAPNQEQLNSDIAMQMNPFDSSVIDTINRQGQREYSVLKQALDQAGQLGSNRQILGANDIDLSRRQQIGTFKQNQFNTALQNALTTLPALRAQSAEAQLGAGANQRNLGLQTSAAGITGLQELAKALGILPTSGGSTEQRSENSFKSDRGTFGNLLGTGSAILSSIFSDRTLKKDIKPVGVENGYPIYEFSYLDDPTRYIGVMADEVERIKPEAVSTESGYKVVNYDMIGVKFREAA